MSRTLKWIAVIVVIAGLGAAGTYWALGTPHYSLFRLGRALQSGDSETAMRFLDLERLAENAVEQQIETFASAPASSNSQRMQNDVLIRQLRLNRIALAQEIEDDLRRSLAAAGGPSPMEGEDWELGAVSRTGERASTALVREPDGLRIDFEMEQQPDRTWKIVRTDLQRLAALLQPAESAEASSPPAD